MATTTRDYRLPDRTRLTLFPNLAHFARHLQEHFLSAEEPWQRLPGGQFLRELSQKRGAGTVSLLDRELETVYARMVEMLDAGMRFAEEKPLFVRCEMTRQPPG